MIYLYDIRGEVFQLYGQFRTAFFACLARWHLERKGRTVAMFDQTGIRL
jgi:hypothetical protein